MSLEDELRDAARVLADRAQLSASGPTEGLTDRGHLKMGSTNSNRSTESDHELPLRDEAPASRAPKPGRPVGNGSIGLRRAHRASSRHLAPVLRPSGPCLRSALTWCG